VNHGISLTILKGEFMARKSVLAMMLFLPLSVSFADVLIEDFNDTYTGQTTLGQSIGTAAHSGYWYGYGDGSSTITPNVIAVDSQFAQAVVAQGPDASKCLHVTMNLSTTASNPYAAVGFQINTTTLTWIDLTAMTGMTFKAKGSGTVRVKLMTDKVTNGYAAGSNWGDMGAEVVLTASWQKFTITPADIKPQQYSPQATDNLTWDACKAKVNKMHFQTSPTMTAGAILDFFMDSLVMQGVTVQTFGGTSPVINSALVRKSLPMTVFSNGREVTLAFPSPEKFSADLFSMSGCRVQRLYNGIMQKATFTLPVSGGNYIMAVSRNGRLAAVPLKVTR
jgi:hypothetical protein